MPAGTYSVGQLIATLGLNTSPFKAGLGEAMTSMQRANAIMASTARNLNKFVTLPMLAAGAASVKAQKDFERSMSKIVGLVGVAKQEVDAMSKSVLAMSENVGRGPVELADALFFVTSAGLRGAEAMDVLEKSAKASVAGLGETKVIADLVTSAMNAYGSEVLNATMATDVLVAAVREGKAEADAIAGAMGAVLPIASEMGVTFDQVGATFAAMTRTGTEARNAATQLKAIMSSLLKPTQQAEEQLMMMGTSAADLRKSIREEGLMTTLEKLRMLTNQYGEDAMAKVFPNIRALMGVLDLMGANMESNIAIQKRMVDSTGALNAAYEEATQTTQFKFDQAISSLQTSLVTFGAALKGPVTEALTTITQKIQDVTHWFGQMTDEQKKTALSTAALVTALGPALTLLLKIGKVVKANPYVALATALATATMASIKFVKANQHVFSSLSAVERANKKVENQYAVQVAEVRTLVGVIENENLVNASRIAAIEKLKQIMPDYNGSLSEEGRLIGHNITQIDAYIEALKDKIRFQVYQDQINELLQKQVKIEADIYKQQQKVEKFRQKGDVIRQGNAEGWLRTLEGRLIPVQTDLLHLQEEMAGMKIFPDPDDGDEVIGYVTQLRKDLAELRDQQASATQAELIEINKRIAAKAEELRLALGGKKKQEKIPTKELGYVAQLQKDITDLQIQRAGASKEELAAINQALAAKEDELQTAMELGVEQEKAADLVKKASEFYQHSATALGYIGQLQKDIAVNQQLLTEDSGEMLDIYNKEIRLLSQKLNILNEMTNMDLDKPANDSVKAWEEYYAKRLSIARQIVEETGQYTAEYKQMEIDAANAITKKKVEAAAQWIELVGGAVGAISTLIEAQKQKELSAAGDNAEKREEIERKYFERQKRMSIAQALINGALAITNMIANVPGSVINPATWVGIGIAAASTAAQVAVISAQNFADGGLIYGETIARMGEYPGARSNPEVVAPLNKLKSLMGDAPGNMAFPDEIEFKVKGTNLVATIKREQLKQMTY